MFEFAEPWNAIEGVVEARFDDAPLTGAVLQFEAGDYCEGISSG